MATPSYTDFQRRQTLQAKAPEAEHCTSMRRGRNPQTQSFRRSSISQYQLSLRGCNPTQAGEVGPPGRSLAHLVSTGDRDWSFSKSYHESSYKKLPLEPHRARLAVIALRSPFGDLWYGFPSRTLFFGSFAAVIRYNVRSRMLAVIFAKIFGAPRLNFSDDFGALIPGALAYSALEVLPSYVQI